MTETVWREMLRYRHVTESGCWEWTRGRDSSGYGIFRVDGKTRRPHRLVAHFFHGLDLSDPKQIARHACDNPPCFNPDHIQPGTQLDNMQDAWARGRMDERKAKRQAKRPTHCKRAGHPLDTHEGTGYRFCRPCRQENQRKAHRAKKQAAATTTETMEP